LSYTAVLFDLDGTLLYTLKDIADSVNQALGYLGFPPHQLNAYKYFVGDGRQALAIRALPEHHRDIATVSELVSYIDDEYSKRWANNTLPYEGITDLLDALTIKHIRLTILSNKPHDITQLMVSKLLGKWQFQAVVGAQSSLPKKPDPSAAVQIARRLDIPPPEFLYLGDSDIDMKTATAADMYPVGVLWGYRTAEELLSNGARKLIRHPTDLLRLL
jgi:phosphoglycolate phosphatase